MGFFNHLVDAGRSAVSHVSSAARGLVSGDEDNYVDGANQLDRSTTSEYQSPRDSIFTSPLHQPEYSSPVQIEHNHEKQRSRLGGSASMFITLIAAAVLVLVLTGKHKDLLARIRGSSTAAIDTISSVSHPL